MARYSLNLPQQLKREAEDWASRQGISLNQFIAWAVAEKIGGLKASLDDPRFPAVSYRLGAAGRPVPVLRGTRLRVQAVVVAHHLWEQPVAEIAEGYELTEEQVREALAFYAAHRAEIDTAMAEEDRLEEVHA